ncbi:hypothetical protein [Priestia endophytica]|nr:hypothetical protein [Priestia endophytica]MCY8234817.1 hypothetical protein [Priestia endophytica]
MVEIQPSLIRKKRMTDKETPEEKIKELESIINESNGGNELGKRSTN